MGRQRKRNSPDLILTLDLGGSLTKGIYVDKSGEHRAMCMEPEAIEIPKSSIDNYERNKFGDANPSDAAWVGTGDTYYAVGYLAATQFNANAGLNQLKVERAVPKVLAAVWVAASEMELGCELTLALAVLLPPGEYESREALERELTESLADYETPAGRFHVTLTRYDCKPEGGGTYLIYKRLHEASLSQNTTAVVMVGYRNASVLNWKNLPHPNGKKTSLGGISLASIRSTLAIAYIENHPVMSKTEMILKALKMCWLPYAFLECGQPTPKSMELGRESDLAIERHRIEMRSVSGLPALDTVTIQAQHVLPTRLESLPPTSKQVSSPEQEEQEQQEPSGAMDLVLQKAEVVNWDAGDL